MSPTTAPPRAADPNARLLLDLAGELGVNVALERSFRLAPNRFLTDRFLLSFARDDLGPGAEGRIAALARHLNLPEPLVQEAERYLPLTPFIHLGFEKGPRASLYKLYLEFARPDDAVEVRGPSGPVPQHLAFKWDLDDPSRHVVSRYNHYPGLTIDGLLGRLTSVYDEPGLEVPHEIARGVVELAAARVEASDLHYLEVREHGGPRRSFDLNLYDARMRVADLYPLLVRMCRQFAIPAEPFLAHYAAIAEERAGHVAGGMHRAGEPFFNIYHGGRRLGASEPAPSPMPAPTPAPAPRRPATIEWGAPAGVTAAEPWARVGGPVPTSVATDPEGEPSGPDDPYRNYCLWPYQPAAPAAGKLRPVNLLRHSFEVAGVAEGGDRLIAALRGAIGPFQTVWGVKWVGGRLAWELYFYDYRRLDREVSMTRVLDALRPFAGCRLPVDESLPYFMFSIDVDEAFLAGGRDVDVIHMYLGNPGSTLSSGVSYALTAEGRELENFYFFFDAARQLREAGEKVACSAHFSASRMPLERILWPDLLDCDSLCVANKRRNDTIYFSGVRTDGLIRFLERLDYPEAIVEYARRHRDRLDHLRHDVGFDYVADASSEGSVPNLIKGGHYGIF